MSLTELIVCATQRSRITIRSICPDCTISSLILPVIMTVLPFYSHPSFLCHMVVLKLPAVFLCISTARYFWVGCRVLHVMYFI